MYRTTVQEYFKWGRGYAPGRLLGEATETLRDIYHTLFGMGSLIQVSACSCAVVSRSCFCTAGRLCARAQRGFAHTLHTHTRTHDCRPPQAAETAWGQNEDLYSEAGHVLAAAMELHARIINADALKDESYLPPNFRFFKSMPPPPANCSWKWDFETQLWASYETEGNRSKCSVQEDNLKYAVGVRYLPNGYELGYNHFAGRLGMKLPETSKLLRNNPVDWFTFSWCARGAPARGVGLRAVAAAVASGRRALLR